MILPVWKPIGPTTHQIALKIGKKLGEKAAHTGSLDPMAEGVVILLTGNDRFRKDELSNFPKHYLVEILAGVSTDTHDLLGLTTKASTKLDVNPGGLHSVIQSLSGTIHQKPPLFSARVIQGKPLFQHALEKTLDLEDIPTYERTVYEAQLVSSDSIERPQLKEKIRSKIEMVQGDFRQKEIQGRWEEVLPTLPFKLPTFTIAFITSRGTYIRSIVRDLQSTLNTPLTTLSLTRTQNGKYTREDCSNLDSY